jgi:hypothetical protein
MSTARESKFGECVFQASDALQEARKWFAANEFSEAESELRRAQREIDAARAALAKAGAT